MDPIWTGTITTGPFFTLDDFDGFVVSLGRFAVGDPIELIVRKPIKRASSPQIKYYWGVPVKLLCEHTGHTPDEMHAILKWKFLKRTDDKGIQYVPSISDLTTVEFEAFLADVRQWAAIFLEVNIPEPNEVEMESSYAEES